MGQFLDKLMGSPRPLPRAARNAQIEDLQAWIMQLGGNRWTPVHTALRLQLKMTPQESDVLIRLMRHTQVSRDGLFGPDRDDATVAVRRGSVIIVRLRKALSTFAPDVEIQTIWGAGYRMDSRSRDALLRTLGLSVGSQMAPRMADPVHIAAQQNLERDVAVDPAALPPLAQVDLVEALQGHLMSQLGLDWREFRAAVRDLRSRFRLSPGEAAILALLRAAGPRGVVSDDALMVVSGGHSLDRLVGDDGNIVKVRMSRIKHRLRDILPRMAIRRVSGLGYCLTPAGAAALTAALQPVPPHPVPPHPDACASRRTSPNPNKRNLT